MYSHVARPDCFFFCVGARISLSPHKNRKKAIWPRETIQHACREQGHEDFLLHSCLINLIQQVDYTWQLCTCGIATNHWFNWKSLNRHHRHGATQQLTQYTLIIMISCHHLPKFFCQNVWMGESAKVFDCQSFVLCGST